MLDDSAAPGQTSTVPTRAGALVISLDFELHWGVRDIFPSDGAYRANLLGAREVIPRLLDLFAEFDVAATWATVGFLFATSRAELEEVSPQVRPRYARVRLDPYREVVGADESSDPLHFAPSLIEQIARYPRQEIGTHTFSHFYCLERGATTEAFSADLASARQIAARRGVSLRSIVFPRGQVGPRYLDVLTAHGIGCYRGVAGRSRRSRGPLTRALSLADAFVDVTGPHLTEWADVLNGELANVPASFFLRPVTRSGGAERLRFKRLATAMRVAAESRRIIHLWWHPHNFGARPSENLAFLRRLLEVFGELRHRFEMRSLSMHEVATAARANLAA